MIILVDWQPLMLYGLLSKVEAENVKVIMSFAYEYTYQDREYTGL